MQPAPTALLQRWYSLVSEKRSSKLDFLKSLVKVFDVNLTLDSSQVCIMYNRGICLTGSHRKTLISRNIWRRISRLLITKPKKKSSLSSNILRRFCPLLGCNLLKFCLPHIFLVNCMGNCQNMHKQMSVKY